MLSMKIFQLIARNCLTVIRLRLGKQKVRLYFNTNRNIIMIQRVPTCYCSSIHSNLFFVQTRKPVSSVLDIQTPYLPLLTVLKVLDFLIDCSCKVVKHAIYLKLYLKNNSLSLYVLQDI